jgi:hypothetical protein
MAKAAAVAAPDSKDLILVIAGIIALVATCHYCMNNSALVAAEAVTTQAVKTFYRINRDYTSIYPLVQLPTVLDYNDAVRFDASNTAITAFIAIREDNKLAFVNANISFVSGDNYFNIKTFAFRTLHPVEARHCSNKAMETNTALQLQKNISLANSRKLYVLGAFTECGSLPHKFLTVIVVILMPSKSIEFSIYL